MKVLLQKLSQKNFEDTRNQLPKLNTVEVKSKKKKVDKNDKNDKKGKSITPQKSAKKKVTIEANSESDSEFKDSLPKKLES